MSGSSELSVFSVVALVLGGVAAMLLAIAVGTQEPARGRLRTAASAPVASSAAPPAEIAPEPSPSAAGELPAGEVEYPLDTSTADEAPRP